MRPKPFVAAAVAVCASLLVACGSPEPPEGSPKEVTVTLMTHDSFNVSEPVLDAFRDETGITVEVLTGGDAGAALNQAILSKDNPVADVFYGVDNTFLARALDAGIFQEYTPAAVSEVPAELRLDTSGRLTPIDYADVCVNADDATLAKTATPAPADLESLTDPRYKGDLVVENPATSSPGLAFLLATIAEFGPDGWQRYWEALRANGVKVVDGWESAYFTEFSAGGAGGSRPLVVSYATSPVATVVDADPPVDRATTSVAAQTCFRQVELAGVLDGTRVPGPARRVVDFLLSQQFQADMPLQMYVYPARAGIPLPQVFVDNAAVVEHPHSIPPAEIAAHRDEWIDAWKQVTLG
ncbi:MAG: thiamine ABC transporter substrate-binding protein [Acidimicrobiia bacterium]